MQSVKVYTFLFTKIRYNDVAVLKMPFVLHFVTNVSNHFNEDIFMQLKSRHFLALFL